MKKPFPFRTSARLLGRALRVAVCSLVISCTTAPPAQQTAAPTPPTTAPTEKVTGEKLTGEKLTVVFSTNRLLELEPCGCSFYPLGGVNREWNQLQSWRIGDNNSLRLTEGASFIVPPESFSASMLSGVKREALVIKARSLVEALNRLGQNALGLAAEDTALGVAMLKGLEKQAAFPFLSANLYSRKTGKPLFRRSARFNYGKFSVLVTALSAPASAPYKVDRDLVIMPPLPSLREVLAQEATPPSLLIVLSTLGMDQRDELESALPGPTLIIGGEGNDGTYTIAMGKANALELNGLRRGRSLGKAVLELNPNARKFYNADFSRRLAPLRANWRKLVEEMEKGTSASAQLTELRNNLHNTEEFALDPSGATLAYEAEIKHLDSNLDVPSNPLDTIVEKYKQDIHDCAMKGWKGD